MNSRRGRTYVSMSTVVVLLCGVLYTVGVFGRSADEKEYLTHEIRGLEEPTMVEIAVETIGLGARFVDVVSLIAGVQTSRIDGNTHYLQVPKTYEQHYRQLISNLIHSDSRSDGHTVPGGSTWMLRFRDDVPSELVEIFHLVFGTTTVRHLKAADVYVIAMPANIDEHSYRELMIRSPFVVSIEPDQAVDLY